MCRMWSSMALWWPGFESALRVLRWPEFEFSQLTAGWSAESFRWSELSIVDDVVWALVTALESVAIVAMLCCFFISCGCTF